MAGFGVKWGLGDSLWARLKEEKEADQMAEKRALKTMRLKRKSDGQEVYENVIV